MSVTIHTWGDAWPMAFYFNCKCGNVSLDGRTAPRTAAMDTFRRGSGGMSLGEWEHNNNR